MLTSTKKSLPLRELNISDDSTFCIDIVRRDTLVYGENVTCVIPISVALESLLYAICEL